MANKNPKTDHLIKQKPKWNNLPTKAIRIPEIYAKELLRYARELDNGKIKPLKRIELVKNKIIAVYAPYDPSGEFQEKAKETVNSIWLQLGKIDEAIDKLIKSKAKNIELILKGKSKTLQNIDKQAELAKELLNII